VHSLKQDVHALKQKGHGSDLLTNLSESSEPSPTQQPGISELTSLSTTLPSEVSVEPDQNVGLLRDNESESNNFQTQIDPSISSNSDILKDVPISYKDKAIELFQILTSNPDIQWTKNGDLSLHNTLLPNVNFFELFRTLFINRPQHLHPGLQKLANFVSTAGYGHLLHPHHTAGLVLPKKRKLSEDRAEIEKRLHLGKKWYYLGP
jgi:hypothetical protein